MPITKKDNVYRIMINEIEYVVKFFENDEKKIEIYLPKKEITIKNIKEFKLYVNFLTDVCESIQEDLENLEVN